MSTKHNESNEKNSFTTIIKLEDDDSTYNKSSELDNNGDYYSTSSNGLAVLSSAYKGKIEVTSKGRRKIFDGVRWQILCRRPECRKQTNKKSLCITHYKEEYETNNNLSSFQVLHTDRTTSRSGIDDENNTFTTTNVFENNGHRLSFHEGQIKFMPNDRRCVLKNNRWQLLCKYNNNCRNIAKYSSLCINHFQMKQREPLEYPNKNDRRPPSSDFDFSNGIAKRLKNNGDFRIPPSCITDQFRINSNENDYKSSIPVENNRSSLSTSKKNQNDQSVQTDLTIPLCCRIYQKNHSFFSTCTNNKFSSFI